MPEDLRAILIAAVCGAAILGVYLYERGKLRLRRRSLLADAERVLGPSGWSLCEDADRTEYAQACCEELRPCYLSAYSHPLFERTSHGLHEYVGVLSHTDVALQRFSWCPFSVIQVRAQPRREVSAGPEFWVRQLVRFGEPVPKAPEDRLAQLVKIGTRDHAAGIRLVSLSGNLPFRLLDEMVIASLRDGLLFDVRFDGQWLWCSGPPNRASAESMVQTHEASATIAAALSDAL